MKSTPKKPGQHPDPKPDKAVGDNRDRHDTIPVWLDNLRTYRPDLAKLYEEADRIFATLQDAPTSDDLAPWVWVQLLIRHTAKLDRVDESNPHMREIAHAVSLWPILSDAHNKSLASVRSKLKRLGVGTEKGYHIRQYPPVTQYARRLVHTLTHRRNELLLARSTEATHGKVHDYSVLHPWERDLDKLPPLTKSSFSAWEPTLTTNINADRKSILANPDLRQLGNTRTAAERPSAAFAEIRQAVLRAIKRILDDPPPPKQSVN